MKALCEAVLLAPKMFSEKAWQNRIVHAGFFCFVLPVFKKNSYLCIMFLGVVFLISNLLTC